MKKLSIAKTVVKFYEVLGRFRKSIDQGKFNLD